MTITVRDLDRADTSLCHLERTEFGPRCRMLETIREFVAERLPHQLLVLRRQAARYTPADRMILATLVKLLPRNCWPIFLVTRSTLLRWHRELIRQRWTYLNNGRRRRGWDPQVVDVVLRLARDNPRWGYLRIVGERRKLDLRVSATSVRTILRHHLDRAEGAAADRLAGQDTEQVSIWLIQPDPTGVKWKMTCGFSSSQAVTRAIVGGIAIQSTRTGICDVRVLFPPH